MRLLILLAILSFLIFCFTDCKKETEEQPVCKECVPIVGKYNLTHTYSQKNDTLDWHPFVETEYWSYAPTQPWFAEWVKVSGGYLNFDEFGTCKYFMKRSTRPDKNSSWKSDNDESYMEYTILIDTLVRIGAVEHRCYPEYTNDTTFIISMIDYGPHRYSR